MTTDSPPTRPVRCWYCGQQMYYSGHAEHEPEVRITIDAGDADETIYLHTRCWDDWRRMIAESRELR